MRNYYCVIASRSVPHFVNDFYVRKCAYKHSGIITLTQGFTPSSTQDTTPHWDTFISGLKISNYYEVVNNVYGPTLHDDFN